MNDAQIAVYPVDLRSADSGIPVASESTFTHPFDIGDPQFDTGRPGTVAAARYDQHASALCPEHRWGSIPGWQRLGTKFPQGDSG